MIETLFFLIQNRGHPVAANLKASSKSSPGYVFNQVFLMSLSVEQLKPSQAKA